MLLRAQHLAMYASIVAVMQVAAAANSRQCPQQELLKKFGCVKP